MTDQVEMADVLHVLERDYPDTFKICVQAVLITNLTNQVERLKMSLDIASHPGAQPPMVMNDVPSFVSE